MNDNILAILDERVKESLKNDEIPIGAVIFDNEGNIISSASNDRQNTYNVLGHAEINAILKAEQAIKDWRLDGYNILINLEPCEMCSVIIKEVRLDNVYYFLDNNSNNNNILINKIKLNEKEYDVFYKKYKKILSTYFKNKR